MKKDYAKPQLYAESFTLVEHVSAGCAYMANFSNDCPITVDGIQFFTAEVNCSADGILLLGKDDASLEDFYAINQRCYNSFVDFTNGQHFFVS